MAVDTPAWVRDAVFYQIFPDRFASSPRVPKPGPLEPWDSPPTRHGFKGGDLIGIAERLDYLTDLGVTALYLNPIMASASNHRYHAYDYLRIDPLLGGDAAFGELLAACRERSVRVIVDGSFNHSGRGFWPFHHILETGAGSPYRGWFHLDEAALEAGIPLRAYPSISEERLLDEHAASETHRAGMHSTNELGYRAWWDLPALPKINVDNPLAREYLISAAEHWIRFGAHGWRLDVADEIDAPFWREFRDRIKAIDPDAYLVGEIWHERPDRLEGDQFDALMNYPLAIAILGFTANTRLDRVVLDRHIDYSARAQPLDAAAFAAAVERSLAIYDPAVVAVQLNLIGSHDLPRFLTMSGGDRAALRLASLLQMTLSGAPCVYYGDEVGVEGAMDPDCRRAFPWDRAAWDGGLHEFVRAAIRLRHANPVLRAGAFRTLAADGMALAYARSDGDELIVVGINAGDVGARLALPAEYAARSFVQETLPGGDPARTGLTAFDGALILDLPPRDAVVLRAV